MFDNLTSRLTRVVKTLKGEARFTESNTQEMLREVRLALLEADVALPVVKDFVARIKEQALGKEVQDSLSPGQALVGIVHKELTALMGGDLGEFAHELSLAQQPPAIILMAGLQGAGKTTTTGKLARLLAAGEHHSKGRPSGKKKVLVVSCDIYRPAAIEQLRLVAEQAGVEWFPSDPSQSPEQIAKNALDHAQKKAFDILMVDTAGRLGIDEAMMREIAQLHQVLNPVETLFVVDAMQGQDAVNVAKAFNDVLPLTGIVLTKVDGDSRGGASLSVRHITGKPIKYVGVSEKLNGLEAFYPDRMAQRILGMGDILSLVEEAQKNINMAEAQKLAQKVKAGDKFDLEDFRSQLQQMKSLGDVGSILKKLPAQFAQAAGQVDPNVANKQMGRMEAILNSMTPLERRQPELLKASRKKRIARGAGVEVQEINRLLTQFEQMQGMMKMMKNSGLGKMMKGIGALKNVGKLAGSFGKKSNKRKR